MKEELLIGSHVSMCAPEFVLGSVKEALSYGANAFMLYSGAPQNTKRQPIEKMKIKEAQQLMAENHIQEPEEIKAFHELGFSCEETLSDEKKFVFIAG